MALSQDSASKPGSTPTGVGQESAAIGAYVLAPTRCSDHDPRTLEAAKRICPMRALLLASVLCILPSAGRAQWVAQASGTTARLRGLCVVNERVVWASGTRGTLLRTIDRGTTWERKPVDGAEHLDFRDVEAFDDRTA